ncbi:MAG: hypothetical protein QW273_01195 [Candidatus Pacearchaeota archaeon]
MAKMNRLISFIIILALLSFFIILYKKEPPKFSNIEGDFVCGSGYCASGMICWASKDTTVPPAKPEKGKICCKTDEVPDKVVGEYFCKEKCIYPNTLKCGQTCCNPKTEQCRLSKPFPILAPNTGIGYCMKKDQNSCDEKKGEKPCPAGVPFNRVFACCKINERCVAGTITVHSDFFGNEVSDVIYACIIDEKFNGEFDGINYIDGCPEGQYVCKSSSPNNEGEYFSICCPKDKCRVNLNGAPYCAP